MYLSQQDRENHGTFLKECAPDEFQRRAENVRPERHVEFDCWNTAQAAGYRTRGQWRKRGKGIRGRSLAYIIWKGRRIALYHENQTTTPKPKTLAIDDLIDRFVVRTDIFGYQPYGTDGWKQMTGYRWDARPLIRQGFNHRRCHDQGMSMGKLQVQAFAVRCGEKTDVFAIDADCHDHTSAQIAAHLELVETLQRELPYLVQHLGGGSIFYQYRQPESSGVQFWATLTRKRSTRHLHATARSFLWGLDDHYPGLDQRLRQAGLPSLDLIEILPSKTQMISLPGCYGKPSSQPRN